MLLFTVCFPYSSRALAGAVESLARLADRVGLEKFALAGVSLLWDVESFRGVRLEAGSLSALARSCVEFIERVNRSGQGWPGVGRSTVAIGRGLSRLLGPSDEANVPE